MRIDKLLWFLRFVKTRGAAQELVEQGHVRLNSRRIDRASAKVGCGDVLVVPLASGIRIIEIFALPLRRGPADEARQCYQVLDEHSPNLIAGSSERQSCQKDPTL